MEKILINGESTECISADDRGFNYGDGFFTTARIRAGQVELWPLHVARLLMCAKRLHFGALDINAIEADIQRLMSQYEHADGVLKVVITRGKGGRGYLPPSDCEPTRVVKVTPYPVHYHLLREQGLNLSVAKTRLAQQPLLAGLKTLNRLEQVLLKQELSTHDADDFIVLDTTDKVIETTLANVLMYQKGKWFTPHLQQAGIEGVYLSHLKTVLPLHSKDILLRDLFEADALYCCNSLMGVVPINTVTHHQYNKDISLSLLAKEGL